MPAALGIHHVFRSSLALSPSFLLSFLMFSFVKRILGSVICIESILSDTLKL